ncbi:unnamed protein product [Rotaria sp. Silwood1]|nr:unnamed protein product [Rotaria sp. Silwood1]CAF3334410.1 unnamed protein product [Rotaria sp. Silwood1]
MILYKHIKNVKTENEAKLLLADIQVRRDAGIFNWFTNISKKIWKLFTSINGSDLLTIWSTNMCKREIIEKYLHKKFSQLIPILFIGDGYNDVCAANSLQKR